ncbi:GDP dissociation inhibitor-domain-containing protein [Amylostereum chailletii]|nr:GDP dissociation inhibitor-domain-containing protein [Amylostereum chailletii]
MDADGNFDVVVLGTGLTESMTAAALSKAGFKVAHLDLNAYYGGDEASLSADELAQWADARSDPSSSSSPYLSAQRSRFTSISRSPNVPDHTRHYSISLSPSLIPSVGPFIASLVASGVARYGGYRLLERVGIYDQTRGLQNVPGSKEDVFKSKDMSLLDKRRLMRFLIFASGDFEDTKELQGHESAPFLGWLKSSFSLGDNTADAIAYALAFCVSPEDTTLPALIRLRSHLRSSGRYGSSPFLVGHYGGLGEIAQGFCRVSAVAGGVYILDRTLRSITPPSDPSAQSSASMDNSSELPSSASSNNLKYIIQLDDFPEPLTADLVISASDQLPEDLQSLAYRLPQESVPPTHPIARGIIILNRPIPFAAPSSSHEATSADEQSATNDDMNPASSVGGGPSEVDTAVVVFPPSSVEGGSSTAAAHAFVTGQASMSAPKGKYIVYLSLPFTDPTDVTPESLLKPYLNALLSLLSSPAPSEPHHEPAPGRSTPEPLFSLFYIQHPPSTPSSTSAPSPNPTLLVTPPPVPGLSATADAASASAEALFFRAVESLKALRPELNVDMEEGEAHSGSGGDVFAELKFWPPLEGEPEDVGEEW